MLQLVNQFSFVLFALPAILLAAFLLLRRRTPRQRGVAGGILLLVAGFYLLANPGGGDTPVAQAEQILQQGAGGQPLLIELYSNY